MQLCAHCLALTVPAATVGSFDPAPHFRTRMSAALRKDSIHGWYARPRDFYAALFAPDTSLDDESFTAAGCSVALTQGFLLRPCHLQLLLWLATSLRPVPFLRQCFDISHGWLDLDHASPEVLGDAGTHARFGRRLMLATGYVMVPPLLGAIFWANIWAVDAATICSNVAISGKRGCLVWLVTPSEALCVCCPVVSPPTRPHHVSLWYGMGLLAAARVFCGSPDSICTVARGPWHTHVPTLRGPSSSISTAWLAS